MRDRLRELAARFASRIPGAVVLLALGAAVVAGYVYDWKLPHLFGASGPHQAQESDAAGDTPGPAPAGRTIRLSADAADKAGVQVEPVRERSMTQAIHAHGTLDYDRTRYARVCPRAAGVVWRAYSRAGEAVHAGDLLAVVESAEVGRAKAAFVQSLVTAEAKQEAVKTLREASASVPDWTQRETRMQEREARARVFSDQQALLNLGLPIAVAQVEGKPEDEIIRRLRLLGLPDAVVRQLDPEAASANLLPVTAPLDGVVVSRDAAVGDTAAPTRPLFVVADLRTIWVPCEVRLEDVGLLRPGQKVVVRPDGADADAPTGTVSWIGAEADEKTHTVQARAEVPNPQGKLRPNTPFEGVIKVQTDPDAAAVPDAAVQMDGPNPILFVRISDDEYEPRPIRVGLRDNGYTQIVSGAAAGERVVTRGSHVLKSEWLKDRIAEGD